MLAEIDKRFALMEARMWRWALGIVGINLAAISTATAVLIAVLD